LTGAFTPVPAVEITKLSLSAAAGVGLTATGSGAIGGVRMSARVQVFEARSGGGARDVRIDLSASNVTVGGMVKAAFPAALVPDFLLKFVQPLAFSSVTLTYLSNGPNSAAGTGGFTIEALPDPASVPSLAAVLRAVGLDPSELGLRLGPNGLAFGVSRSYSLSLPQPFTGPGEVAFALALDSATNAAALSGSFAAALAVPGLSEPLGLSVAATLSAGAGGGVSLAMSAATTTAVAFKDFPWLRVGAVRMAGALSFGPTVLTSLSLSGELDVLGAAGNASFTFNRATGAVGYKGSVDRVDLQQMLGAMGVSVNLGARAGARAGRAGGMAGVG
jgi:hypothetical protein